MQHLLSFFHTAEKLKQELRHSWLSNGRQESVAEHTWRLTLMAMTLEPYFKQPVNMEKLLKMLIIHDLAEVAIGDIPAFEVSERKNTKHEAEAAAMQTLCSQLGEQGKQWFDLWQEGEQKETYEAKVANAIDKLEAQLQHNEANINTWLPIEHEMTFRLQKHTLFDETMEALRLVIVEEAIEKLQHADIDFTQWHNV